MLLYSFHKKGNKTIANTTTNTSRPINKRVICKSAPSLNTSPNADFDNLINNNNWGMMRGKPRMAIIAAF